MLQSRIPDVDRVRQVFEEVLSQPAFRTRAESPLSAFLHAIGRPFERFFRSVGQAVGRLLARWLPGLDPGQICLIGWVALVALIGLLLYVLIHRFGGRQDAPRPPARARAAPADRTPAGWMSWARERAMAGRLRDAASGLYQAVILSLEARGALRYGEWKTPGDYAIEVSGDPGLRGPFRGFLAQFVAITFGPADPTPEALATLFDHAERLGCPS
jgi:Domain of unknown function (DUF4129)